MNTRFNSITLLKSIGISFLILAVAFQGSVYSSPVPVLTLFLKYAYRCMIEWGVEAVVDYTYERVLEKVELNIGREGHSIQEVNEPRGSGVLNLVQNLGRYTLIHHTPPANKSSQFVYTLDNRSGNSECQPRVDFTQWLATIAGQNPVTHYFVDDRFRGKQDVNPFLNCLEDTYSRNAGNITNRWEVSTQCLYGVCYGKEHYKEVRTLIGLTFRRTKNVTAKSSVCDLPDMIYDRVFRRNTGGNADDRCRRVIVRGLPVARVRVRCNQ